MTDSELLSTAQSYHEKGFAIIPFIIDKDGSKVPDTYRVPKWEQWQTQPQTNAEFDNLHIENYTMFGVICGAPIEKDGEKVYFIGIDRDVKNEKLTDEIKEKTLKALNEMKPYTHREITRSGGQHLGYFSRTPVKGKKFNSIGMELLAEGNLMVMAPSEGYKTDNDNDFSLVEDAGKIFYDILEAKGLIKRDKTVKENTSKPAPLRPCFIELMKKAHLEHLEKVSLVYELYYSGKTQQEIEDLFKENKAWEPSPDHTYDEEKTEKQVKATYDKAASGNYRYRRETLDGKDIQICLREECPYYNLTDCRIIHPTIEELKEKSKTIRTVMEGDFKDYETVEDGLAWFIATLYKYEFATSEVKDAITQLHNEAWIKGTEFFRAKVFRKAKKILEASEQTDEEKGEMESQADKVYKIFTQNGAELFHDQNGLEYARIPIDATDATDGIFGSLISKMPKGENTPSLTNTTPHIEKCGNAVNAVNASKAIVQLKDDKFSQFLAHIYYEAENKIIMSEAITQVTRLLKYEASKSKQYTLSNRVASDPSGDGSIWLDIADKQNHAYHITKEGWTLETEVPILFKRYDHQKPLAVAAKGGDTKKLLPFVNIGASKTSGLTKHRQLLLLIQTASYAIPNIPRPINSMFGSPGSHKSTAQRFIREIFDPSEVPYLRPPKDDNAALQVLDHHYIPIFDNLQYIPDWFSDMLCGAVTGTGQESRALFTDDDSFIRSFKRCIMLNGVSLPPTRGDLLNRTIMHPTEPSTDRRTEKELDAEYQKVLPEILGGFLDILVTALNLVSIVKPLKLFRLADFSEWGYRLAVAFGATPEDFEQAMEENLASQNSADIENNIVADSFLAYCNDNLKNNAEDNPLVKTPEQVLQDVATVASLRGVNTKSKKWPSAASYFTRKLNDSKNAIIASGFNYEVVPTGAKREMRMWYAPIDNEEDWFKKWVTIVRKIDVCHGKFKLPSPYGVFTLKERAVETYNLVKQKYRKNQMPIQVETIQDKEALQVLINDCKVFFTQDGFIAPMEA